MLRNVLATTATVLLLALTGCTGYRFDATVTEVEYEGDLAKITAIDTETNIHVSFICGLVTELVCADLKPGDKFTATSGQGGKISNVVKS